MHPLLFKLLSRGHPFAYLVLITGSIVWQPFSVFTVHIFISVLAVWQNFGMAVLYWNLIKLIGCGSLKEKITGNNYCYCELVAFLTLFKPSMFYFSWNIHFMFFFYCFSFNFSNFKHMPQFLYLDIFFSLLFCIFLTILSIKLLLWYQCKIGFVFWPIFSFFCFSVVICMRTSRI